MTSTTPAASATLANGCVVRVGDALPTPSGRTFVLLDIEDDPEDAFPLFVIEIHPRPARKNEPRWVSSEHIDLAKLAEQQAALATAQPAGATVRELVERWRTRAAEQQAIADQFSGESRDPYALKARLLRECAAELSAALPGGMTEGLADIVRKCGEQFRFYERNHRAKEPPQHDKADVNEQFAEMCEAALRAAGLLGGKDG